MGTFYNGADCDIYIGKGAGKKLLDDISKAKNLVKIVSPYLSPFLIKELISLHERGIAIHLITTDTIEDFYGAREKNIYRLIRQHRIKDENAEMARNKWIRLNRFLLFSMIGWAVILSLIGYFYRDTILLYAFIPLVTMFLVRHTYRNKIRNKRIFSYEYSRLFPFKVYISPENNGYYGNMMIHGKIYIIDDRIVYMGSLNFTGRGTKDNYETRIRTTDNEAVKKIVDEFDALFHDSGLPEKNIQVWGRELYHEPIN